MVKIIKPGESCVKIKTVWHVVCPDCGCEFECELEDFKSIEKRLNGDRVIDCPWCHKELHTNQLEEIKTREVVEEEEDKKWNGYIITKPNMDFKTTQHIDDIEPALKYDPCEACPNKDGPKDSFGNPIAGDSMCIWCSHYKYKIW